MTRLALALACLLAGTLVSTSRGSATSAAAGANIGAASILCEAAMQADAISEQAKALPCGAVKTKLEETLNSVPAEVWDTALKHSERLRKQTMNMVGNWTRGNTLTSFCDGEGKGTRTRLCSAKRALDTCTKQQANAERRVTSAVEPTVGDASERWWKDSEANRDRQKTHRPCASVPRWSTCARARPTVTHASAREQQERTRGRKRTHRSEQRTGSRRNLAESKDSAVQGKTNGQKYQHHNRALLGTGNRQEHWGKQGATIGRVRQLYKHHR
ncbi:hypothetical protein ERJ75_000688400 [Trypanosoma vivax]|nr:hypothetical protein ERJ75_000688400 [Trypanosoma vivax]